MEFKTITATDRYGGAAIGATVTAWKAGTNQSMPATIYDINGVLINQPGVTDSNGHFGFAALSGALVDVVITNASQVDKILNISFLDPNDVPSRGQIAELESVPFAL